LLHFAHLYCSFLQAKTGTTHHGSEASDTQDVCSCRQRGQPEHLGLLQCEEKTWKAKEGDDGDTRGDGTGDRLDIGDAASSWSASKEAATAIVFWTEGKYPAVAPKAKRRRVNWSKGKPREKVKAALAEWKEGAVDENGESLPLLGFANIVGIPERTFRDYAIGKKVIGAGSGRDR
jgi:membrane-bound inhibitor of C-type lysozyme